MPKYINWQKEGGIEWCDGTHNPIPGCTNGCPYCYARRNSERFKRSFTPTFYPERLKALYDLKTRPDRPWRIFLNSMGDLFCDGVKFEDVAVVMYACYKNRRHNIIISTKNPDRAREYAKWFDDMNADLGACCGALPAFPPNVTVLTSVTEQNDDWRILELLCLDAAHRGVSVEPLLGPINLRDISDGEIMGNPSIADALTGYSYCPETCLVTPSNEKSECALDWVIIGAMTGPGAVKPQPEWVSAIIADCQAAAVPVFVKSNVHWDEKIQEFPEWL